jgi:CRP-like cAMP-binding protein
MSLSRTATPRIITGNRLLDALSPEDLGRILPHLERIPLPVRLSLHAPGKRIEFVLFPDRGMVSVVASPEDGVLVEVGVIGREGLVGVPALVGAETSPHEIFVQVAGSGWRMKVDAMRAEVERSPAFRDVLFRYAQYFLIQVAQTAACNARHPLEARLARWLLMARDRLDTDAMPLTQEFLAIMLGVQRPGVSLAAGALQRAGAIRYTHGRITVADRARLEAASCECHGIVRREFDRLFPTA